MDRGFRLFPEYSLRERLVDGIIHCIGVPAGFAASIWLLTTAARHASGALLASLSLYSFGLVSMLSASALYHFTRAGRLKEILRRTDHAAIFVMIAGSYTPFAVNALEPEIGVTLSVIVWAVAGTGIILKIAFPRRLERFSLLLYLALGWAVVPVLEPVAEAISPDAFTLLLIGGVLYTIGAGLHVLERLPYHNAAWHALVLAGATCHFLAISKEFLPHA